MPATRWAMRSMRALRRPWRSASLLSGERFTEATTPYNTLVAAATGLTDSSVEGSRDVQAAFVELDMPITKSLDLDVSDREDRYSDFGTTNNAKLSVRYQPIDFLTFRGTASTGFRAPTLFHLYSSPFLTASDSPTMGSGNPFCSPGNYTAEWTPATCNSQGLALNGGNKKLGPETSQNFDLGVIVSPIQDMGITLDYYRILLKNAIQTVPASAIYGDPASALELYRTELSWDAHSIGRRGQRVQSLHGTDLWIHPAKPFRIRAGSRPTGST